MTEAAATSNNSSAASEAIRFLQEWTQQNILPQVVFANDTLQYSGHKITANTPLAISDSSKSCTYSAASLFLQLLHPGLIQYRNECKKYNVIDPVKATDKAFVVAFFSAAVSADTAEVPVAMVGVPTTITTTTEPPPKKARKEKSHHSSKSSQQPHSKQPKPLVTNEQLFDRLNVVVDKRQPFQQQQQADEEEQRLAQLITKALNADGFAVTPELLQEHGPRTELILQQEIPVGNSASILRAVNPQKDLSRVLELFQEATKGSSSQHHHHKKSSSSKVMTSPTTKPLRTHLMGQKPVILVPKGMTAPLTLVNAHEFLANAKYVPREKIVQQNQHRNPLTTFTRPQEAGRYIEYEIMDNPRKLGTSQAAWDRVVAVIVLGQSWQFKDWLKGYQTPATLFDQVYGFFVSMEGDQLPPEVATWAVHVATLNRDKRGLDQVAYATFWNGLEEFIRVRKPELFM